MSGKVTVSSDRAVKWNRRSVVVQFDKEARQTRDYCVARSATHRAARPDPSRRKERLLGLTNHLHRWLLHHMRAASRPGRNHRAQKGDSAAGVRESWRNRAARRSDRRLPSHNPSRSECSGRPAGTWGRWPTCRLAGLAARRVWRTGAWGSASGFRLSASGCLCGGLLEFLLLL
jgi:hypothetical protein